MKSRLLLSISAVLVVFSALAADGGKQLKPQTKCPVMGGAINKELYVEHEGKIIYMCCEPCRPALEKDFVKYEQKLLKKGIGVESVANREQAPPADSTKTQECIKEKKCCPY